MTELDEGDNTTKELEGDSLSKDEDNLTLTRISCTVYRTSTGGVR